MPWRTTSDEPDVRRSGEEAPPQGRDGRADAAPPDLSDPSRGVRLQKYLAEAGVASRRASEQLIEAGEVAVNGRVVTDLPVFVDPKRDRVTVSGRPVHPPQEHVYVMLFKERGVECTNAEVPGRRRAIDVVQHPSKVRLFPVGRLDVESSGLLLMTNDGELANRLTHPRYEMHKAYEVTVDGALDENEVKKLERGLYMADRRPGRHPDRRASRTRGVQLTIQKRDRDRTRLLMELREGRNRQIRRMMAQLGHKVRKLRRVRMGPLKLRGLRPGQWRELLPQEVKALKRAAYGRRNRNKT